MAALQNLQLATAAFVAVTPAIVAAINAPKGVAEADVQAQADVVNAQVKIVSDALTPPAAPAV